MQKGKSIRPLRVSDEIRRVIADVLIRGDLFVEGLKPSYIMVTEVNMSPDLSHAMVFVRAIEPEDTQTQVDLLNAHKGPFRKQIGQKVKLRIVPEISFKPDMGAAFSAHIDELLQTPHVKQDLD